jgi:uncharacterized protein
MSVMSRETADAERLIAFLRRFDRIVVAFSGGVDSSVVAAAAMQVCRERALAVTANSPSVPAWQLELARQIASQIGIAHRVEATGEGDRPDYRANDQRRCFHCKETLYQKLAEVARPFGDATIVSGTNADDLGDYRPGIEAGRRANVITPLADLGLGKRQVRAIARHFGLSNHDLPASPCLASRIAYGTEVTPERLARIEQAEQWLAEQGFAERRVRLHAGELARIEVPRRQLGKLLRLDRGGEVDSVFRGLGFHYVTIDLHGFESGSMNRVVVPLPPRSPSTTRGDVR